MEFAGVNLKLPVTGKLDGGDETHNEKHHTLTRSRLSELPDRALVHILSHLYTEEAARTRVLSKRFNSLWNSVDSLIFSDKYSGRNGAVFVEFVDAALRFHVRKFINKFSLEIDYNSLIKDSVDAWLNFAAQKQIMSVNSFSLRSLLEKEKLNGSNFLEWYRNLRIVLKQEKKVFVLEKEFPKKPDSNAHTTVKNAWKEHNDANTDVCCLILATMNSELQKQYENMESAYEIVVNLKVMFQEQARTERYNTVKAIFDCKMGKDEPVSPHVIKMIGYFDNLERLDARISQQLATDIVLQSLNPSYNDFILNYNMHNLDKSLKELHGMLKTAEPSIKKASTSNVLMIQKGKGFKKQGSDKGKGKSKANVAKFKSKPKSVKGKPSEDACHYCNEKGHWKRNCKKYLEDLKNGNVASTSGTKKE